MADYQIAQFQEQGVDLIIIPVSWTFSSKPQAIQQEIISRLQACAATAGLTGTVVPVWQRGSAMYFIAPKKWHPFFKSISWEFVQDKVNRKLACDEGRVAIRSFFAPPIRAAQPNETTQLDEAILCATVEALETESPELVRHIDAIVCAEPVWSGGYEIGQSVHDRYEVKLPKATLDLIIGALKRIEALCGYNKTFAERQINLLVLLWSRLVPADIAG